MTRSVKPIKALKWMVECTGIQQPYQQYFSHVRTMLFNLWNFYPSQDKQHSDPFFGQLARQLNKRHKAAHLFFKPQSNRNTLRQTEKTKITVFRKYNSDQHIKNKGTI